MKLMILSILLVLLIVIMLCNNSKEGYDSTSEIPDLTGTWQIPSISENKPRTIKLSQKNEIISGNDYYCLGSGSGKIVHNRKIIWMWGNRERTKMIGDIILQDLSNKPIVTEIRWQNGYSWKKILPADNISGEWEGPGLSHGPISIVQNNNNISATYPVYGLFIGTVINNRISIEWQSGVKVKGTISKDNIKWDSGIEWERKSNKIIHKNQSSKKETKSNLNTKMAIDKPRPPLKIPPPPLEVPKKKPNEEKDKSFSSPLPPLISGHGPYAVLTSSKETFTNLRAPAHMIQ